MTPTLNPNSNRGVTLVELVATLVVALITLSLAAPQFSALIQQVRLSSAVNELHTAIALTRTEAVTHNTVADLSAINGNWINGWVVTGSDQKQILMHEPLHPDFKINAGFSDGKQHVGYGPTGHSVSHSNRNASQYGHIQLSLGEQSRIIVVNFLGRVRICNPAQDKFCEAGSAEQSE